MMKVSIMLVFYDKVLNNTLGEIISKNNLTQTRIAETENIHM